MMLKGSTFEWDRPNTGLYEGNKVRIIDSRHPDGSIAACHAATPEEARAATVCELLQEIKWALIDLTTLVKQRT